MIRIEQVRTYGWEAAIRGMRNPLNSWDRSDSTYELNPGTNEVVCKLGKNDITLMKNLVHAGPDHSKFLRMIGISMDVTAPLYWWKEFDTYKVGTVANSCSTMHKIADKEFTLEDFSHEHLINDMWYPNEPVPRTQWDDGERYFTTPIHILANTIEALNFYRDRYLEAQRSELMKKYWWQMIQLLPSSYNQKRTVTLNYAVALNQYRARKTHKLDEWKDYCNTIHTLPYFAEFAGC